MFSALAFMACDKVDKVKPTPNEDIPEAVYRAVQTAYTDASGLEVSILKKNELYQVDFVSTGKDYEAIVSEKGEINELRKFAKTVDIPAGIQAYLDANFPDASVDQIVEDLDPMDKATVIGYWVYITTTDKHSYQLYFDSLGAFISQIEVTGSNNDTKYSITAQEMPAAIATYLDDNHSGYVFMDGVAVVIDNVTSYYISITYNNFAYYYEFAEDGTVISVSSYDLSGGTNPGGGNSTFDTYMDATQIPATITDYLDLNFAGWAFSKGGVESDNGTPIHYTIVIAVGVDNYVVEFDGNMVFIGATHF